MPGYRRADPTAATTPQFTARRIQHLLSQKPTSCFAYPGGSSRLLIKGIGAIILS
jgi:hypothetical protein